MYDISSSVFINTNHSRINRSVHRETRGQVTSLVEFGTGFDAEFIGRGNVYLVMKKLSGWRSKMLPSLAALAVFIAAVMFFGWM